MKKALIVEDNIVNKMILERLLKRVEYETVWAENGEEALKLLDPSFSIIFMDLRMPVMDGHEATRKIREQEKFDHIPIIVVTASCIDLCGDCSLVQDVIEKPFKKEQLYEAIDKIPKDFTISRSCKHNKI